MPRIPLSFLEHSPNFLLAPMSHHPFRSLSISRNKAPYDPSIFYLIFLRPQTHLPLMAHRRRGRSSLHFGPVIFIFQTFDLLIFLFLTAYRIIKCTLFIYIFEFFSSHLTIFIQFLVKDT